MVAGRSSMSLLSSLHLPQDAVVTLECHVAAQRELRASATFALVLQHALVLG